MLTQKGRESNSRAQHLSENSQCHSTPDDLEIVSQLTRNAWQQPHRHALVAFKTARSTRFQRAFQKVAQEASSITIISLLQTSEGGGEIM
jgi:hypothetical protein